jgi:hypothetical protein
MVDPVSIGLSVGAAGLGALNSYRTADKQDKIMKLILERRARQQEELDRMIMGEVGMQRSETPEAERAEAMNEFVGQLRATRAAQPSSYGARGQVSTRETQGMDELQAGLGQFAGREADITARLDAPGRMRQNQALRTGRLGTGLREQTRKMESSDFLDQLRLSRARRNPWLDLASSVLGGIGQGRAVSGGGGGAQIDLSKGMASPGVYFG